MWVGGIVLKAPSGTPVSSAQSRRPTQPPPPPLSPPRPLLLAVILAAAAAGLVAAQPQQPNLPELIQASNLNILGRVLFANGLIPTLSG